MPFLSVCFPPKRNHMHPTTLFWIQGKGRHLSIAATCYRSVQANSHSHFHFVTVGGIFGLFSHLLAPHGNSNPCTPFHKVLAVALKSSVFAFLTHKANAAKQIPLAASSQAKESLVHFIQLLPLPSAQHAFLVYLYCPVMTIPLVKKDHNTPPPFSGCRKKRASVFSGNV